MFQKVHIKLTFFCAVITIGILFVVAGIFLSFSERTLTENHSLSFQHGVDNLLTSLEQHPSEISNSYLHILEQNNKFKLYLWDNGVPFLFNSLHMPADSGAMESSSDLVQNAIVEYEKTYEAPFFDPTDYSSYHRIFTYKGNDTLYDVCKASIYLYYTPSSDSTLTILLFSSREPLRQQLFRQRILVSLLCLAAGILLSIFAWIFTGRLIRPIEESRQTQNRFIASASHELRTPLAVIRASIDTKAPGYERIIQSECTRMKLLVDDMLNLTSLENGVFIIHKTLIEPDTLLLNLYEQMEPLARAKNQSLLAELPDRVLPPCNADRERLLQVLFILTQNAISYTPEGGKIRLSVFSENGACIFVVEDNGVGISDADKAHIFERFFRADNARTEKEHFGLGLCIAKEIMDAHEGSITVKDTPGGGSTFMVRVSLSPFL